MRDAEARPVVLRRVQDTLARYELIRAQDDVDALVRWAEEGDAEAQYLLGRWRERQYQDPWMAFEWLERAAAQRHGAAARALAELYRSMLPDEAPSDEPTLAAARVIADAVRYWALHASAADEEGILALPAWAAGPDPPADSTWPALSARLQALAERGNVAAAYRLGVLLWCTPVPESPEPWLTRAAEGGHREAMSSLGRWCLEQFDEGHFSELLDPATLTPPYAQDVQLRLEWQARLSEDERQRLVEQRGVRDRAVRWLRAAAERDDVEACVELADFLSRSGEGGEREAVSWYERAAQLGDVLAMLQLAKILRQGFGVPADLAAAERWYARAAARLEEAAGRDDGFAPAAASQLAELYLRGNGVPRDADRAIALFEQAGARGYTWALITLGGCYERGDGLPRDLARAERCFARAVAAGGDSYAQQSLDRVRAAAQEEAGTVSVAGARVPVERLRAAEAGDAQALWEIARQIDVEGDPVDARPWMERAARAGHAGAAFWLAFDQPDDEHGRAEARRWRRLAAGLGHVNAMEFIGGELVDPGEGHRPDAALGYAWLTMASRERHDQPPGVAALQRANAKACAATVWETLSPGEKARAERIVQRCDAGPPYRLPDEVDGQ